MYGVDYYVLMENEKVGKTGWHCFLSYSFSGQNLPIYILLRILLYYCRRRLRNKPSYSAMPMFFKMLMTNYCQFLCPGGERFLTVVMLLTVRRCLGIEPRESWKKTEVFLAIGTGYGCESKGAMG